MECLEKVYWGKCVDSISDFGPNNTTLNCVLGFDEDDNYAYMTFKGISDNLKEYQDKNITYSNNNVKRKEEGYNCFYDDSIFEFG